MSIIYKPAHAPKAGHSQHARPPGQPMSAQDTDRDSGAPGQFKAIINDQLAGATKLQAAQPAGQEQVVPQPDLAAQQDHQPVGFFANEMEPGANLIADLLKRLETTAEEKAPTTKQRGKEKDNEQSAETASAPTALFVAALMSPETPMTPATTPPATVEATPSPAVDLSSLSSALADDQPQQSPDATIQPFEGVVVASVEVRSYPELSPHRGGFHESVAPSSIAPSSAPQAAETHTWKGAQSLNVVLALSDAEPLRCSVRNVGDALSISVATSDPQTVAYLRDNDHVLRANLERMGIQTESMQIRLSVAAPQASQDSGQFGSQGQQQSSSFGAPSGQRHNSQTPYQERQPNQSTPAFNEDKTQDDRSRAGGRYL